MIAVEDFDEIKERLGAKLFDTLYKNEEPRVYQIVGYIKDEIAIEEPFAFVDGIKYLKTWHNRKGFKIIE
jgi:hypothetical protein